MNKRLAKLTIGVVAIGSIVMGVLLTRFIFLYENFLYKTKYDDLMIMTKSLIENPIVETVIEYKEPELQYLGNFKITYYCSCEKCCGKSNGITATGTNCTVNRTIAVDPSVIPYGSQVLIGGIVYTAEDCGGAIKDKRIDIYVNTHEEALQKGVDYLDVYLLK